MTTLVADDLVARNLSLRTKDETTVETECEGLHHVNDVPFGPPAATHSLLVDVGRLMLVIWLCDACAARAGEDVPA